MYIVMLIENEMRIERMGDEKSIEIYVAAVSHLQILALSPFYDALAPHKSHNYTADTIKL